MTRAKSRSTLSVKTMELERMEDVAATADTTTEEEEEEDKDRALTDKTPPRVDSAEVRSVEA